MVVRNRNLPKCMWQRYRVEHFLGVTGRNAKPCSLFCHLRRREANADRRKLVLQAVPDKRWKGSKKISN